VKEVDGLAILDNVGGVVNMAELLADLKEMGVTRSKREFCAALYKQGLTDIRKL